MFLSKVVFNRIRIYFDKYYKFKMTDYTVYSRSSVITSNLVGSAVLVHRGNGLVKVKVSRWMVGYKFGEFTWNRRNFKKSK